MLQVNKLRWKNLLSYGNYWTELKFDDKMSIIVGKNGSGKTSSISALTFALFGKPYSRINRPNLINSINNKGLLTEVEFEITESGDSYKIIRGMKPNVFEIYVNGVMMDQDSSRDQQKYLEENVLKCNFRAFTNLVVLGASGYTPFMHQTPAQRRDFIENILDINIFSQMNQILKEKNSMLKEIQSQNEMRISKTKSNVEIQRNLVTHIEKKTEEEQEKYDSQLKNISDEISLLEKKREEQEEEIQKIITDMVDEDLTKWQKRNEELHNKLSENRVSIQHITKEKNFIENHTNCPTCKQEIKDDYRNNYIEVKEKELETKELIVEKLHSEYLQIQEQIKEVETKQKSVSNIKMLIDNINSNINSLRRQEKKVRYEKEESCKNDSNYKEEYRKLENMEVKLEEYERRGTFLSDRKNLYTVAFDLLKDTGIKSQIISQYIPIINKLVSGYLQEMDFSVSFTLDKDFNESILSRYRDNFTYDSFSQGEKNRIDLALLFTWRSIAEIKNSIHTNILFFDEIFDGSLDYDGIEVFLKILENVSKKTNIFVISHKISKTNEIFDKVYRVEKHRDFSYMKEGDD